jgi:hypothetical protein
MKVLLIIAAYVFIGSYVGAKIYRRMEADPFFERGEWIVGGTVAMLFWPLVVLGVLAWLPVRWMLGKVHAEKDEEEAFDVRRGRR